MSDAHEKPPSSEGRLHANLASIDHHSAVMTSLSSTYASLVGLFSATGFTVGLTVLATDFGHKIVSANWKLSVIAYFVAFGLSFILDLIAVIMIVSYSFHSFNDHRLATYRGMDFTDARDKTKGGFGIAITAFTALALLVIGALIAVHLVINYNGL